jgi:hypothetical protein
MNRYVEIQLDKARNLKYGMLSLMKLEKKIGKTISQIDFNALSIEDSAIVLWAGLIHEDKELTVDKVVELVDNYSDIKTVFDKVGEAISVSFGGSEEKK